MMEKLKRVRSLSKIGSKQTTSDKSETKDLSLEEALEIALDEYIQRYDPLEKAKRSREVGKIKNRNTGYPVPQAKSKKSQTKFPVEVPFKRSINRTPLPAALKHYIYMRDQGRCRHQIKPELRCSHTKYLEIHHVKPISHGGGDTAENLRLLCTVHHRMVHGHS